LNIAEIEASALRCHHRDDRRMPDRDTVAHGLHAWEAQRNRHRATITISSSTRLYHTGAQRPELSAAQLVQDRAVQCCPARRYQRTASPTDTGIAEVLATGGTLSDAQTTFLHLEGG